MKPDEKTGRVTTKFKIGKKSGKSREFDFQAKSREKVVNFVESLEKVLNFGQIVKLIFFPRKLETITLKS